jgi:uncharacterized protein (DUF1501 family)
MHANQREPAMLDRRDFLHAAGALALGTPALLAGSSRRATSCIFLFLVGGPSQLDTWDPKPDAPSEIRGPSGVTRTRLPGILLSEHFPKLAGILDRVALVRTLHHDAAPIHETGHQMMQSGKLHEREAEHPHIGAVLSYLAGSPWAVLGGSIGNTGVGISHGQGAGYLGAAHEPVFLPTEPGEPDDRYGDSHFGQACRQARRLIETGTRFVTVNMFNRVLDTLSWDCHADDTILPTTLADYGTVLCPMFDQAYTTLILDLEERGLLDSTLVVAAGEFGRTPKVNARGGRDHWPGAWSVLLAGGGIRGGQVVGKTDGHAAEPVDRPVTPGQFVATVYRALGVPLTATIPGPAGRSLRIMTEEPLPELI